MVDGNTYLPWHPALKVKLFAPPELWRVGRCATAYELTNFRGGVVCALIGDQSSDEFFDELVLPHLLPLPSHLRNSINVQKMVTRAIICRILKVGLPDYDGIRFIARNIQLRAPTPQ